MLFSPEQHADRKDITMSVNVELMFRKTDNHDAIGYLVSSRASVDDGFPVRNEGDFKELVRGTLNGSDRARNIWITNTMETARTLALLHRRSRNMEFIITKIADDIHALGTIDMDGEYNDGFPLGIPVITDLRETGPRLVLDTDFRPPNIIHVEIGRGDLKLLERHIPDDSPTMNMTS